MVQSMKNIMHGLYISHKWNSFSRGDSLKFQSTRPWGNKASDFFDNRSISNSKSSLLNKSLNFEFSEWNLSCGAKASVARYTNQFHLLESNSVKKHLDPKHNKRRCIYLTNYKVDFCLTSNKANGPLVTTGVFQPLFWIFTDFWTVKCQSINFR